ncbi:MAG: hypothetical protein R3E89_10875 [Thiolinea sp.]
MGSDIKLSPNSTLTAQAHYIKSQQDASDWSETGGNVGIRFEHY